MFLQKKMIETLVTPIAIAELLKGRGDVFQNERPLKIVNEEYSSETVKALQNAKMRYTSLSLFSVLLPVHSHQYIEFILSRKGIVDWKLTNLKFLVEDTSLPPES